LFRTTPTDCSDCSDSSELHRLFRLFPLTSPTAPTVPNCTELHRLLPLFRPLLIARFVIRTFPLCSACRLLRHCANCMASCPLYESTLCSGCYATGAMLRLLCCTSSTFIGFSLLFRNVLPLLALLAHSEIE